jgi:hypothetical protein
MQISTQIKDYVFLEIIIFCAAMIIAITFGGGIELWLHRKAAVGFSSCVFIGLMVMFFELIIIHRGGSFPGLITTILFGLSFGGGIIGAALHHSTAPIWLIIFSILIPLTLQVIYLMINIKLLKSL